MLLAGSPLLDGIGGRYFADANEAPVVTARPVGGSGVADYAVDPWASDELWRRSLAMIGR